MKPDREYQSELIAAQQPRAPRATPLARAHGRVLADSITSRHPIPLFDNSAMDGYAVHAEDVADASAQSPVTLPVAGDIPAGATTSMHISAGQVARIMTGAPMPTGADAVVQVEHTDGGTNEVQILGPARPFVRRAGEDMAAGDLVVASGTVLGPRELAAIASAGHGQVLTFARPKVGVIATGSELRDPGEECGYGQIPNSNSTLITAALADVAEPVDLGIVSDDAAALRELLDHARTEVGLDAVVLSGGVSVGAYDVVKEVLGDEPGMWFGPVAMQPGKPQGSGTAYGMSIFALPGNPVSVYVSVEMLVRPALRRLGGQREVLPRFRQLPAGQGWRTPAGRTQYLPARLLGGAVVPATSGGSGSHLVGGLAQAQGLARVPAETEEIHVGDTVQFWEEP